MRHGIRRKMMGNQKKKKQSAYKKFVQKFEETKEETIEKLNRKYVRIEIEKIEIINDRFCFTFTIDGIPTTYKSKETIKTIAQKTAYLYNTLETYLQRYINEYNESILNSYQKNIFSNKFLKEIETTLNKEFRSNIIHVKETNIQIDFFEHSKIINLFDFCNFSSYMPHIYDKNNIITKIKLKELNEDVQNDIIADITKKLFKQTFKIEDKILKRKVLQLYEAYNNKYSRLITGLPKIKNQQISIFANVIDSGAIRIKTNDIEWILDENGMHIVFTSKNMKRFLKLQETDDFQECKDLLIKLCKNKQLHLQSDKGLLNGSMYMDIIEPISNQHFKTHIEVARNLFDTRKLWLETIENAITEIEKTWQNAKKDTKEELKQLKETFLAHDIIEFLKINPNGYITIKKLTNYLKGRKIVSSNPINKQQDIIPYKNYTDEEINNIIKELVYKYEVLRYQSCNNKSYILSINSQKKCKIILSQNHLIANNILPKLYNDDYTLTDAESKCIFESIKNKDIIELTDCNILLRLISSKGFICKYKDEYISTLKKAPDAFKALLKLKIENEEDTSVKNIYKAILKKIKEMA